MGDADADLLPDNNSSPDYNPDHDNPLLFSFGPAWSDLLTGTTNVLPFRLSKEISDDLQVMLRIALVREVPMPAAQPASAGANGDPADSAVASDGAEAEPSPPHSLHASGGDDDAAGPSTAREHAELHDTCRTPLPGSPAEAADLAQRPARRAAPQRGVFAALPDSPSPSASLSPSPAVSSNPPASPEPQLDLLMTDDESDSGDDGDAQAGPVCATRASGTCLAHEDLSEEQQDAALDQAEQLLLDQPADWEAGALPGSAAAPMTFERFLTMALEPVDPSVDPVASTLLLCSITAFREAACRATEEVTDAIREVAADMQAYFPAGALKSFRLFSPSFHLTVNARNAHLSGREKEEAVARQLVPLVEDLAS